MKLVIIFSFIIFNQIRADYDLTLVGQIKFAESLPRLAIGIIDCLKHDVRINVIRTPGCFDLQDVGLQVKKIITCADRTPGTIALFTDIMGSNFHHPLSSLPNSPIKIAYSMLESTAIPEFWVSALNEKFDAVVVPDEFYKEVYVRCGVIKPIFVISCGMYIEDLLQIPLRQKAKKPFVFGMSAAFQERKNFQLVARAFAQEFGNNPDVKLILHGRGGFYFEPIEALVQELNVPNIKLIRGELTAREYSEFLSSLDCYVLLSKGEGFSLTPREAMAAGIPVIISDATSHQTICDTGLVRSVLATIKQPAYYSCFRQEVGHYFDCTLNDAREALRDMYDHYDQYLAKTPQAREWVKQYLYRNLKPLYLTLIKPRDVILGDMDTIRDGTLVTTSQKLYELYHTHVLS